MRPTTTAASASRKPTQLKKRLPLPPSLFMLPGSASGSSPFAPPLLLPLLTFFLALQFLIPAPLVIGGLGAAGRPSAVVALGLTALWVASWLCVNGVPAGKQPVRWIVAAFLLTSLLAYGVGYARGLPEAEAKSADRDLIFIVAMCGLAFAIADGVGNRRTLDAILQRMTWFAAVMSIVGIIQSVTGINPANYIWLPGLTNNTGIVQVVGRGSQDVSRVAGTANHYIEFGTVLAVVAPVAIHYALFSSSRPERFRRWALALIILVGAPLSIARSAVLCVAVSTLILAFIWTWRTRLIAFASGLMLIIAFRAVRPGVLGTLMALFRNADVDPSIQHRTSGYGLAGRYFQERPLLGRGLNTFLPNNYVLLDNELIYTALTAGLIGLAAFVLLFIGGYFVGRSVRHHAADDAAKHLGQALAGSLIAALVASATFDGFFYPTFVGVVFMCLGATGALFRLTRGGEMQSSFLPGPSPVVQSAPRVVAPPLRMKWEHYLDKRYGACAAGGPPRSH